MLIFKTIGNTKRKHSGLDGGMEQPFWKLEILCAAYHRNGRNVQAAEG